MNARVLVTIAIALLPALPGCAAPASSPPERAAARKDAMIAKAEKPVSLASQPVRVTLKSEAAKALASRVEALPRGRHIFLVIGGLRADRQPGVSFDVFLDLPADAPPAQRARHLAGNIHYYDAVIGETGNPAATFSLDITDLARSLGSRGLLGRETTLVIAPADGPPAGKPVIGRLEIIEQ